MGAGPAYTLAVQFQYAGVMAGSVVLFSLALAIRREAAARYRPTRWAAAAAMGLSAASAALMLATMVCQLRQASVELTLYGVGRQAAELTWLAFAVLGLAALSLRPRPVFPAVVLSALFLAGMATEIPVPYSVTGPAGEPDTSYLIRVQGGERHPGHIYGLTLWGGPATAADYLFSRVNHRIILMPDSTRPAMAQEDATLDRMLVDSEAMAKAIGLQVLGKGKGATPSGTGAVVTRILPDSPAAAAAAFHPGDVIVGVNGAPISAWAELMAQVKEIRPGAQLTFAVQRGGKPLTLKLITVASPSNPDRGTVGIQGGDQLHYDIPVPITTAIPNGVGGPSLGLALTLQVIDQFTPGGITQGWRVAATGEILPDGKVGAIGGAEYKVLGAERAGAGVIFVPRANYEAALSGSTQIQVVPVDTVQDAVAWLKDHPR
jgi:PDZ domain-containing protein